MSANKRCNSPWQVPYAWTHSATHYLPQNTSSNGIKLHVQRILRRLAWTWRVCKKPDSCRFSDRTCAILESMYRRQPGRPCAFQRYLYFAWEDHPNVGFMPSGFDAAPTRCGTPDAALPMWRNLDKLLPGIHAKLSLNSLPEYRQYRLVRVVREVDQSNQNNWRWHLTCVECDDCCTQRWRSY